MVIITTGWASAQNMTTQESHFRHIPSSQQLAVYWYWIAGNMSEEGVVKDLHAMKKAGINRVQIGMIGEGQGAKEGSVKTMSEEWWNILHQALKTAGELDIEVGMFNCPGWSQSGGPWVKAEQAMRYLHCIKDTVTGPQQLEIPIQNSSVEGQTVKVIAYPLTQSQGSFSSSKKISKEGTIHFIAQQKTTVRSLVIYPASAGSAHADIQVKTDTGYVSIHKCKIDRSNAGLNVGFTPYAPIAISLPETEGNEFMIDIDQPGWIHHATLSDVPVVEQYAEKTFAKMWPTPHPMWDAYLWRQQPQYSTSLCVSPTQVIDITSHINKEGVLQWNVPKGQYVIMHTEMLPTGTTNAPAPKESTGYETDKMSKAHIRAHFDAYIGQILRRIPPADRKTFRIVVEDSYETGGQNWTDSLITDFKKTYHYDPVPFLPVLSGTVVGSEDQSDRFLWDLRRLIADQVSYNYVGGLREVSHEHGLTTWLENYGHWGFPGEFLQYGGQSDEIAGEFWSFGTLGDIENRVASSCGHIYGKPKIWAESFTCGGPDFTQYPGQMKQRGDRFFAEGINATLLHLYIQQPDDKVPGINAWFGNEFNRHNTWFSQMDVFANYLKRCNYMLQQGQYVADVAYFIGEDAPKMTGVRTPELPRGFSFDYINAEVLQKAFVKDKYLCLPSGMKYRVLVLPRQKTMRPELLAIIRQLVNDGLVILGPAPEASPSLQNYPQADERVKRMAGEMWQTEEKPFAVKRKFGQGRIYPDASLEQVMNDLKVLPDFLTDDPRLPVTFLHRHGKEGDIYFISNQGDQHLSFNASFRITERQPELWNPQDASIRILPEYMDDGEMTRLPIQLEPFESAFIVFRHAVAQKYTAVNYPKRQLLTTLKTPWQVDFQQERGGPQETILFDSLTDWTHHTNPAIKYFSGSAVYRNTFKIGKLPDTPVFIDLNKVMVMAKVKINGKEAGGVWTPPYRLDITSCLHKGTNTVEIEVVNCWRNRIIGDLQLPENQRITHQSVTYLKADSELQSSGLMGPVEIVTYPFLKENK